MLGMLALVAAAELLVARGAERLTTPVCWDWIQAGRAARREARGCRVLAFGDSLIKCGVAPAVIEGRLGGRAHNLAVGGGLPPADYFLLRRALAAGARPRAVLIGHIPH